MAYNKKQTEQLTAFAQLLKENGFTVIVDRKHPFEWLYFEKNGHLATVQPDYFGQFNFGTKHRPSEKHASGFSTSRETELTIENAAQALTRPGWARNCKVDHYKSVDEFIKMNSNEMFADYYVL